MTGEPLGAMLRRHRIAAGWSQNELARQAGCDPAYVNQIERPGERTKSGRVLGAPSPRRPIVLAFAEALDVSQAETDRLLFAAGLAPQADWQTRAEAAEAKLEMVRQTLDVESDLVIFRRRTG